jgi:two-component system, response regulator YesN
MYNLLIVDDEPIIVEGLFELFSGMQDLELEVFKAYSGVEALQMIKKVKPDIVLSDICMPDIDGIQLQRSLKSQWPSCKIIFLTGYNDFDYIQAVMRSGGSNYILKTEGDELIIDSVHKVIEQIEAELKNEEILERAKESMLRALPLLQKKYIMDLLEGFTAISEESSKDFKDLQLPIDCSSPVMLLTARVDNWNNISNTNEKSEIIYKIEAIAENYLSKNCRFTTVVYERTKLLWIIQPMVYDKDDNISINTEILNEVKIFAQGTMELIQKRCKDALKIITSFAVSDIVNDWKSLPETFYSLKLTLNKTAGVAKEALLIEGNGLKGLTSDEEKDVDSVNFIRHKLRKINLLENCLESGQEEEFFKIINSIFYSLKNYRKLPREIHCEVYYTMAMTLLSHINKLNLYNKINSKVALDSLMNIGEQMSWDSTHEFFTNISEAIFEYKKSDYVSHNDKIVQYIHKYIEENISGDLSVTKFAEVLHFNPSYLSRLYKQYTGQNLTDYISEVKFIRAKLLLRQSNIKINEISAQLGFETPSYFTRFFKKKTNLTPQEFREN